MRSLVWLALGVLAAQGSSTPSLAQAAAETTHELLALVRFGGAGPVIRLGEGQPSLPAILGGFNTGFTLGEGGALLAHGEESELVLPLAEGVAHGLEVELTPRAPGGLSVFSNGRRVGRARLSGQRQTLRFDVPATARAGGGDTFLTFAFHARGRVRGRLLRGQRWTQKPVAEPRRATFHRVELTAAGAASASRSLDAYAYIAAGASFVGRVEGDGAASVRVSVGNAAPVELSLRGEGGAREGELAPFAGKLARLTLVSSGTATWKEARIVAPAVAPVAESAVRKPKNVVLWVIDTLRTDRLRCFNAKTRVRTPNFDSFARQGVLFERAISQSSHSKPAAASLLTGHYPASHGASTHQEKLRRDIPLLPELFQQAGFDTAGFASNGFIGPKHGFVRGWTTFQNLLLRGKPGKAPYLLREVEGWLEQPHEKPFFLYVHSVDPHVPYNPPRHFLSMYWQGRYRGKLIPRKTGYQLDDARSGKFKVGPTDKIYAQALYDGEVSVSDHFFGKFLDTLDKKGLTKDTLVIVTADHGEEFWEHGNVGHGHTLYNELISAPLIFGPAPFVPAARRVATTVEMVDLAPTLLELAGLAVPEAVQGRTLLPLFRGEPVVPAPAFSVHEGRIAAAQLRNWKYIVYRGGAERVFDLDADPGEQRDLSPTEPVVRRHLRALLSEWLTLQGRLHKRDGVLGQTAR